MPGSPQKHAKRFLMREAISEVLREASPSGNEVDALKDAARAVYTAAKAGDIAAFREIADRLDGKPAQQLVHSGDEDNPVRVEKIVRDVVKPSE
jgi:hypothetical protein